MNDHESPTEGEAFEYALGTLTQAECRAYEQLLEHSPEERARVAFWREQLMSLQVDLPEIPPEPSTWMKILEVIAPSGKKTSAQQVVYPAKAEVPPRFSRAFFLRWAIPFAAAATLLVVALVQWLPGGRTGPNLDYVAVLTDAEGRAVLTAMTLTQDSRMWLKWEALSVREDVSLQLWAVSKRDGQIRSIAVFDDVFSDQLALTQASFRLIADSSFLLLTEEEPGGSAIDEPSELLVGKGVCVRLTKDT